MKARTAYFCYEKTFSGNWTPVVYYDDLPTKSVNGYTNHRVSLTKLSTDNTEFFEVVGKDLNPKFEALRRAFPLNVEPDILFA